MFRSGRDEELEEAGPRGDIEVTLGPAMLLAIVCGLLLVCGLCFGVGYTAGRANARTMAAAKVAASGQTLAVQTPNGSPKPGAKSDLPAVQAASQTATSTVSAPNSTESPVVQSGDPTVRPAMAAQTPSIPPGSVPAESSQVQSALSPGSGVMVQVAAVSHLEDANVLMAALRKRGYAVTARRGPDDSLIHVQVGPFANRNDANAMSQRLLNDGYNAVVMP